LPTLGLPSIQLNRPSIDIQDNEGKTQLHRAVMTTDEDEVYNRHFRQSLHSAVSMSHTGGVVCNEPGVNMSVYGRQPSACVCGVLFFMVVASCEFEWECVIDHQI